MLSEEQTLIRDTARALPRTSWRGRGAGATGTGVIEPEVLKGLGDLGFLGMTWRRGRRRCQARTTCPTPWR